MSPVPHLLIPLLLLSLLPLTSSQSTTCSNYGTPNTTDPTTCDCPAGFLDTSACVQPVCGGSLATQRTGAPASAQGGTTLLGNTSASVCACDAGWTGPGCTVCRTSQACGLAFPSSASTSSSSSSSALNTTLTCSTAPTTYTSSQLSCAVINPTLQFLFPLSSYLTIQRTLSSTDAVPGASFGPDGSLFAQLWYDGVEQFYCQASGCNQTVGSATGGNQSDWTCRDLSCHCIANTTFCSGSADLSGTIDTLSGGLEVICDPPNSTTTGSTTAAAGACVFKQDLLDQLFAGGLQLSSCSFGECVPQYLVDQSLGITSAAADTSTGTIAKGVIAGLAVLAALILLAFGALAYAWFVRRRERRRPVVGVWGSGGSKRSGAGVRWDHVGYEVRSSGGRGPKVSNLVGWVRGRGAVRSSSPDADGVPTTRTTGGKLVLDDVSGSLPAGSFTAVLGPSGAGKSTFVDILAGRRKVGGRVMGTVAYFGGDAEEAEADASHRIGFVDQSDVLSATSTVYESLLLAARLRMPENVPDAVKRERVTAVMTQLGLTSIAHSRIGSGERRGISGGEMRRLSIGLELVAAPDVLIADEPTSGLDSVSAANVISVLRSLTRDPHSPTTVIASIHQPSSKLYQSFDNVLLLAHGRQLYFGPGGNVPAEYFEARGLPCPAGYNVADHLLEIASSPPDELIASDRAEMRERLKRQLSGDGPNEVRNRHVVGRQADLGYTPGEEKDMAMIPLGNLSKHGTPEASGSDIDGSPNGSFDSRPRLLAGRNTSRTTNRCRSTFLTQVEVLCGREWRNLRRDKTLLLAHLIFAVLLGLFAGGLYYQVNLTIAGFQNRIGSLFFLGSLIAFSSLSALSNLVESRSLFLRERAGSYYHPSAWLVTRLLFDLVPLRIIPTVVCGTITYWMVGLSSDVGRFFKAVLVLVEYGVAMGLFNFLLACVIRNGGVAILLSSLYNLFLMTYAGFFVNLGQIPPVLRWLRYLSTLGYTLEALSVNEVGSGLAIVDTLAGVPVNVSAVLIMKTLFGFGLGNYWRDVVILWAWVVAFTGLLFVSVWGLLREGR